MPTPQQATVRFMVSIAYPKAEDGLLDRARPYSSAPMMLVCLALKQASMSRCRSTVRICFQFSNIQW